MSRDHRSLWILVMTCLAWAGTAPALDCEPADIGLHTQADVDGFRDRHGACDRVRGDLEIISADIDSLAGLAGLASIGGKLVIENTERLQDLQGLEHLRRVGGTVEIFHNNGLLGLDGLDALARVDGDIGVFANFSQRDINGLRGLARVDGFLAVSDLPELRQVDGLRALRTVDGDLLVVLNARLTDLQGLYGLQAVGGTVRVHDNPRLDNCAGLLGLPLADTTWRLFRNQAACNSPEAIRTRLESFRLNPGLNDAWHNPLTPGQGMLLAVYPARGSLLLGWLTREITATAAPARLGDASQRWLTAQGPIQGPRALLELVSSRGGVFNSAAPVELHGAGSLELEFSSCHAGVAHYRLPDAGLEGWIPLRRLAHDRAPLCEAMLASGPDP